MKRTINLKLTLTPKQSDSLLETQKVFASACNSVVPFSVGNRCWNRVALHHFCYYPIRKLFPSLGSQMVCNAIKKVCTSFKVLKVKRDQDIPVINFRENGSVHYDKRTFALKGDVLSLFTVNGRIKCSFKLGDFQREYLKDSVVKEAELIRKGRRWFFNVVLDIPDVPTKRTETLSP